LEIQNLTRDARLHLLKQEEDGEEEAKEEEEAPNDSDGK